NMAANVRTKALRVVASVWCWWSASGRRNERNEVSEAAQPERRRQLQTEAAADAVSPTNAAFDDRVVCGVERAWSRGRRSRPVARGTKQSAGWSQPAKG